MSKSMLHNESNCILLKPVMEFKIFNHTVFYGMPYNLKAVFPCNIRETMCFELF